MKKFSFIKLWCVVLWIVLGMGQAFADNCAADYVPPDNPVWDGSSTQEPCTKDGYYIIDNAAKLAWYAAKGSDNQWNYNRKNAKLTADIDLGGKLWIPIAAGQGNDRYSKIFDGDNHVIKNMYINGSELAKKDKNYAQNLGFVGTLGNGTIKNLILENVDIQASTNAGDILGRTDSQISVGAFVGWMADKSTSNVVDNCVVASGVINTTGNGQGVGGIVGNAKIGTISNCMSLVEIRTSGSKAYIGGIIGIVKTDVTVASCVYAGPGLVNTDPQNTGAVGGVAGFVFSGELTAEDDYFEGAEISGVGAYCSNCTVIDETQYVETINTEEIVCQLNGTNSDGSCKTEPWSMGESELSLNGYGADGYKITFKAYGGEFSNGDASKSKFLDKGQIITADEIGEPSREGYSFLGWALDSTASSPENLGVVSGATTIYAIWEEKIAITFNANGGLFPPATSESDAEKIVYFKMNDPITVEDLGELPEKYCYETACRYLVGWSYDREAIEPDLNSKLNAFEEYATENTTIYAVWKDVETHSVTFHAEGSTTVDFVTKVEDGSTVTERPEQDPSREGYDFAGWYYGDEEFVFTTEITESIILNAKWTPHKYTITYELDGGTNDNANPSQFTVETNFTLKNPTKSGSAFVAWFYDAECTKEAQQIANWSAEDKTLYAKWTTATYKIIYSTGHNNTYGSVSDQTKTHGEDAVLASAGDFKRAGYVQDGWYSLSEEGDTTHYVLGGTYSEDAPVELFPHWKLSPSTIVVTGVTEIFVYDGKEHSATCQYDWDVPDGFSISVTSPTKVRNVATAPTSIECSVTITNDNGEDVTDTYKDHIVYTLGDISVKAREETVGAVTMYTDNNGKRAIINGEYSGNVQISYPTNVTLKSVVLNRKFEVGKMSTIMLPFTVNKSKVSGGQFYKFNRVVEEDGKRKVKIGLVTQDNLGANTPYLVMPTDDKLTFKDGVTLNTSTKPSETLINNGWEFWGAHVYTQFNEESGFEGRVWGFAAQAQDGAKVGQFVKGGPNSFVQPLRAVLIEPEQAQPSPSPLLKSANDSYARIGSDYSEEIDVEIVDDEENVLGIAKYNTKTGEFRMEGWFDLKGRKLNSKPAVRGSYYHNGKRVIVK